MPYSQSKTTLAQTKRVIGFAKHFKVNSLKLVYKRKRSLTITPLLPQPIINRTERSLLGGASKSLALILEDFRLHVRINKHIYVYPPKTHQRSRKMVFFVWHCSATHVPFPNETTFIHEASTYGWQRLPPPPSQQTTTTTTARCLWIAKVRVRFNVYYRFVTLLLVVPKQKWRTDIFAIDEFLCCCQCMGVI